LVFLTGFADLCNEEAYDLGACAILNKPIQREELQLAVARFLKPPRELWSTPVTLQLKALVEKRYESLGSALQERALSLGRGGVFIRDCESMPEDVPVGFQVRFAQGKATRMDGCGIVCWQRTISHQNLPAGVGIEILRLDPQALDPIVEWIYYANPRAFIPKQ
jgi:hypothetical protein